MLVLLGVACTVVVGLSAAASPRATWTWTDGAISDHRWDTNGNWDRLGYPDDPNDDPLIPHETSVAGWQIDLVAIPNLGDMTIEGDVRFGDADPNDPNTIICPNSLLIDGDDQEVEVSISDAAIVVGAAE